MCGESEQWAILAGQSRPPPRELVEVVYRVSVSKDVEILGGTLGNWNKKRLVHAIQAKQIQPITIVPLRSTDQAGEFGKGETIEQFS